MRCLVIFQICFRTDKSRCCFFSGGELALSIPLKIQNPKDIHLELVQALYPHRANPTHSVEFIAESEKNIPLIGLKYPGKKVKPRDKTFKWANLYDFQVVPYSNGAPLNPKDFTFEMMLDDFYHHKRNDEVFWKLVEGIYSNNTLSEKPPILPGIESRVFLLVLKWIFVQEDMNYKHTWKDVESPEGYVRLLKDRDGSERPVSGRGAGRAKFFALMILVKYHFTIDDAKKIIPLYA